MSSDLTVLEVNGTDCPVLFHVEYDKIIQRREKKTEKSDEEQNKASGKEKNEKVDENEPDTVKQ